MNPWNKLFSDIKEKYFYWKYDYYEGVLIKVPSSPEKFEVASFNLEHIEKTLNYIFINEVVPFRKSDDSEDNILDFYSRTFNNQKESNFLVYLLSILIDLEILNSNSTEKNFKVWLRNIDWKSRIENNPSSENSFPIVRLEINHITFSVKNLSESIHFYNKLLDKQVIALANKMAYYDLDGLWFALNENEDLERNTYDHIAFSVAADQIINLKLYFDKNDIEYSNGRERSIEEGLSVYVKDPDGHLIEFHSATLDQRLDYYSTKEGIKIFR